jgi:hypothetical protein
VDQFKSAVGISFIEDEPPLQFWQRHAAAYPLLSTLARTVYGISPASACVERVFSSCKQTLGTRSTLGARSLGMQASVKIRRRNSSSDKKKFRLFQRKMVKERAQVI